MANRTNQLKVNGTTYGIQDKRISTGSAAASGGSNGDIYIKTGVTATGTGNGWTYVTRADGVTECWKAINVGSVSVSGTWGSYTYVKDAIISSSQLTYPVTFASVPAVFISIESTAYNGWRYSYGTAGTTTLAPNIGLARANSSGSFTGVYAYYHVIGVVA